jgi:hypothetical protein
MSQSQQTQNMLRAELPAIAIIALSAAVVALLYPPAALLLLFPIPGFFLLLLIRRHPLIALHLFILVLPASNFLLIFLYRIGMPASVVKALLYWEETVAACTIVVAVATLAASRAWRKPFQISVPDLVAAGLALLVVIYAIVTWQMIPQLGTEDLVRAVRDQLLYLLMFFVGRLVAVSYEQGWRILRSLAWITIATVLIGFFERIFVPITFFVAVGVPEFYSNIVGHTFPADSLGLPENFWTSVGGITVRRTTSVYTSSQPFSISFMLLLPACMWLATHGRSRRFIPRYLPSPRAMTFWTLLAIIALMTTITRANVVLGMLQVGVGLLFLRTRPWHVHRSMLWIVSIMVIGGMLIFAVFFRPLVGFIQSTVTFTESSSRVHKESLVNDLAHIGDYPLGRGLGTAGITSLRAQTSFEESAGGEGQYSKLLREMGLPGFVAYGLLLGTVTLRGLSGFMRHRKNLSPLGGISFVIFLCGMAILLNAVTTEWQGALSVSLVFWWLAGLVVTHTFRQQPEQQA